MKIKQLIKGVLAGRWGPLTIYKINHFVSGKFIWFLHRRAIQRYFKRVELCRPCFEAGQCLSCGCEFNPLAVSNKKCLAMKVSRTSLDFGQHPEGNMAYASIDVYEPNKVTAVTPSCGCISVTTRKSKVENISQVLRVQMLAVEVPFQVKTDLYTKLVTVDLDFADKSKEKLMVKMTSKRT